MTETRMPGEHEAGDGQMGPADEAAAAYTSPPREDGGGPEPEIAQGEAETSQGGAALVEPPQQAIQRLTDELDATKDRYLRLAAEFDNYKKRTVRERSEMRGRAQAEVIANTLDALDDLARVSDLDPTAATVQDVLAGVELVERKLLRELESAGLKRVGAVGEDFDPNHHEAIGSVPATGPEDDGTVAAVMQVGYRFGDILLRPARVQVAMFSESADQDQEVRG